MISAQAVSPRFDGRALSEELFGAHKPTTGVIDAAEHFIRRFCILPDAAYLPLSTWAVATHVALAFDAFPYIALLSPTKRCGKTRVLEVLELLTFQPWRGTSPSSAALFRMMANCPTLLLDEVEALRGKQVSETQQAILAVLNAGYRQGATVPRCDGPKNKLKFFPVYGPKAFAAIGGLPDTLSDRCVCIAMHRRTAAQPMARFLYAQAKADSESFRELVTQWARNQDEQVRAAYQAMPDLGFLTDRDAELFMPLFAVCSIAAPESVAALKKCALALTGAKTADDIDDSLSLRLLSDVGEVWPVGAIHLSTEALLKSLKEITESPWGEYEMSARKLSRMLRPFGARPRTIRMGSETPKGYLYADLEEAFCRYLPSKGDSSATSATTPINTS